MSDRRDPRRNAHRRGHPYQRERQSGAPFPSSSRGGRGRDFNPAFRNPFDRQRPSTSSSGLGANLARFHFPPTTGVQQNLGCNFVKLLLDPSRTIWEYNVFFEEEVCYRPRRIYLAKKHFSTLTNSLLMVYDGGSLVWSPIKTENEVYEDTYELKNGEEVKVILKKKCQRNISDFKIILNVILQRLMSESQLVKFRKGYYNPDQRHLCTEHKLEIWPGFDSTVRECEGGILLNIDLSFKILQIRSVSDILSEILINGGSQAFKERAQNYLLGSPIITKYNNKVVRIDDIDFEATPLSLFERKGEKISYVDYYKSQYNIKILDHKQPMLVNRLKKKSAENQNADEEVVNYYVPELCYPTGLFDEQRTNFPLMKRLSNITQIAPGNRDLRITEFLRSINQNKNCQKLLTDWGLKLPNETMELEGKVIPPVRINVGNSRAIEEVGADFGRALSREKVLHAVPLENWALVYTAREERDERIVHMFSRKVVDASQRIGMRAMMPRHQIKLENERPDEYCRALKSLGEKVKMVTMVMIVFPTKRTDRYGAVKQLCHEMNIPSQVIISKTISNEQRVDGIALKVAMQINCKLGGSLWSVDLPHEKEGLMIVGVSHESGRIRPVESTVALVASVDRNGARWISNTIRIAPGQNVFDNMSALFEPCLREWIQLNGKPPAYVIVYREGIDDGQLSTVQDVEVARLKQVFSKFQPPPSITYIVVQSRNNTRIYAKDSSGKYNPQPGTVVDHTITKKNMTDFYLVSPTVRVGTVTPTHYIAVENSSGMSLEVIQSITYKMTHLYFNWNASIRVPAPCQYAQRLAQQVGQKIMPPTSPNMRNSLFFL